MQASLQNLNNSNENENFQQIMNHALKILNDKRIKTSINAQKQESRENYKGLMNKKVVETSRKRLKVYTLIFEDIPSTMILSEDWPRQILSQENCFVFQAQSQSSGIGQGANQWSSPKGNMYLTVLLQIKSQIIPYLPVITANTILKTIRELMGNQQDQLLKCKWINDIFYDDKKVSGILIKTSVMGAKIYTEIGVGINIQVSPLLESTCLNDILKKNVEVSSFTDRFILNLVAGVEEASHKNPLEVIKQYQKNLLYLGEEVNIFDSSLKEVLNSGIFIGVNEIGNAMIAQPNQVIEVITKGRMRAKAKVNEEQQNKKEEALSKKEISLQEKLSLL